MNSSVTRTLTATLLALLLLLAGCAEPQQPRDVEATRVDALTELAGMQYVDEPHRIRQGLEQAHTVSDIDNLLRMAESSNDERREAFWGCAAGGVGILPGVWSTIAIVGDGSRFNEYRLTLDGAGTAGLVVTGGAEVVGEPAPVDDAARWLEAAVGKASGWSADLDAVITGRTLPAGMRASMSGTTVCTIPFTLTINQGQRRQELAASMAFGFQSSYTLFVLGQPFEQTNQ